VIIKLETVSENTRSTDYLGAGNHLVTVVSFRSAETMEGKAYFEIGFIGAGGATHRERWYLSERAVWRLQRDLKTMGLKGELDTEDEVGTLGKLKASSYILSLKAKPEYNGKIYCEASSVVRHEGAVWASVARPRFALAPQEQGPDGTDEDIPF
jgi:hypothetical protein